MTAVLSHREAPLVEREQTSPLAILELFRLALDKGVPVEALERLQAMHERASDRQAAAEFAGAVADFQRRCPPIAKNAKADYVTKSGGHVKYAYAELPEITKTIAPHLQAVGLAYTWDSAFDKGQLTVTCILRHVNGHRERAQFACPVESNAGMSEQQKHAAALSFGRRQSLIQVLGLVTSELEKEAIDPTPITEEEAGDLELLCEEAKVSKKAFLKWLKVESFAQIPAARYEAAVQGLRDAKAAKAKKESES